VLILFLRTDARRRGDTVLELTSRFFCLFLFLRQIFYINYVGTEIYPLASPEYLNALESKEVLVYSCGSLWTR